MKPLDLREASLRRAVHEARAEEPAPLDWEAVEERLLRHAQRRAPSAKASSAYPVAWAALAAAATLVLWLLSGRSQLALPQAPPQKIEAARPTRTSGDALAVGSRILAHEQEVSVSHAGRATWTLARGSSAVLIEKGERIALRLERGSVVSEVVANPRPETFVVEAAQARIAVQGTVFGVELSGGRVVVNVREGTVGVGALGSAPGFLLKAPAHGEFTLDGKSRNLNGRPSSRGSKGVVPSTSPMKPAAGLRAQVPMPSASVAAPVENELALEPSISDIEAGIGRVVEATTDCFSQNTKGADGVEIMVRTALTLEIAPTGAVSASHFLPPLSPEVEACASARIGRVGFAPSLQGVKVTRLLELKR